MKNLITASIITTITVLMLSSIALANGGIPAGANVPPGVGDAPIVKAKWEVVVGGSEGLDDNSDKPLMQVDPPLTYQGTKTIGYWMVVTDPNGFGDLTTKAYADVTHPDGTFKYQVELTEKYDQCPEDGAQINASIDALKAADAAGLVTYSGSYDLQDVIDELEQCSAKAFYGTAELDYHQMCGECTWTQAGCPNCEWEPVCCDNAYLVEAYAFDKYNVLSAKLSNKFEYICTAQVELDFQRLNFGNVIVCSNKWIEGDTVFDGITACPQQVPLCNPACAPGVEANCRAPTIRNIGNTPVDILLELNDMGFGSSTSGGTTIWNVEWDGRLGLDGAQYFDPQEEVNLGELGLCNTKKISFSIHVKKATTPGPKSGTVWITPDPVAFPWW